MEITATIPVSLPSLYPAHEQARPPIEAHPGSGGDEADFEFKIKANAELEFQFKLPGNAAADGEPAAPREMRLQLRIDENTGEVYSRIIDGRTGEAVRELPVKEIRRMSAQIKEMLGHLIDKSA